MSKGKQSFEESLNELEKLVQGLEDGDLSLDESLKKFEEGTKLYKFCKDELTKAEKKITKLSDSLKEVALEE
ncbi:exodeoxyribonuclease VII small subunit [Halobacteriovorax marinus]|uniref:Exodeoxyribonuclease 7 small subunit n=1 Tax=Halobacteriovorax marinus (strain ATCC BAA-682 / DSM 15412 / SJ) TaxID=862908 RepID=E1X123_HALMS|nr:exodeoxyribonuclease VII small subunit [Halobacteriovorax marinus]ATH09355.1 exodeoxyribonuclease VII small subunit [Halobacteriovorax marinus]CBW28093.1 putative exodeoxyribonuclease VII small subunit [Halobacteriovorax marinus SJ]